MTGQYLANDTLCEGTAVWAFGARIDVELNWITATHVEVVSNELTKLRVGQRVALLLPDFIGMPMQVEEVLGNRLVLEFVQPYHEAVIELMAAHFFQATCNLAKEEVSNDSCVA